MPPINSKQCPSSLVVLLAVENSENGEEQVDDIEVKADGSCDLLLDVVMSHDKLSVHKNIPREDQSGESSIDQLGCAAPWEEGSDESEQDQSPQTSEQIRHPRGKVVLCLACKECEANEYTRCKKDGLQHYSGIEE